MNELNTILNWIDQLNEVNLEGIEPLATAAPTALPMREDRVSDGNIRSAVLTNAPHCDEGFFVVPKSVE